MQTATKEFLKSTDELIAKRREEIRASKDEIVISGETYYVSESGDDRNDGKTEATAWRTLKKVSEADLNAGDGVRFRRGDIFRGLVIAKEGVTYAAKITKEDCLLDFTKDARTVHNQLRGLAPIPLSFTHTPDGKLLKVTASRICREEGSLGEPGRVLSTEEGITVACGKGSLTILGVLPEGKPRMSASDFVRGRKVGAGDLLK